MPPITSVEVATLKIPLDRDIVYLAEAGEESTPQVGIGFLAERHWDRIDSEFALADFEKGLARIESRQVFGKVIVNF